MPNFETFTKRRIRVVKDPTMTLQAKGGMGFNHAAFLALGEPEAVELLYAADERIIGVRPVDPGTPHAYPVRSPSQKRDSGFLLSGKTFTKFYEIDTSVARRWTAYMDGDVLCVDLNSPSIEVTGPRAGKTQVSVEDADEEEPTG